MRREECAELAPLRSAWVDGSLSPVDTDRLMRHLAGCSDCVREVRALCRVRDLLSDIPATTQAPPAALAERLVRIAGIEAREPLWTRPFRRTRCGTLPSRRRLRRRRVATTAVATATFVTAVSVVGYAAAPASALTPLPDPTSATRSEFSATLSELPLGNDALASVLMVRSSVLKTSDVLSPAVVDRSPVGSTWGVGAEAISEDARLDEKESLAALSRADTADQNLSYAGTQQVQVAVANGSVRARVEVDHQPSTGTDVVVHNSDGREVLETRVPAPAGTRGPDDRDVLELVGRDYALTGQTDAALLGRRATLVEAHRASGELAARWWIDADTGLLLRQEVYDHARLQVSTGFTKLQVGGGAADDEDLTPLAVPQTTSTLLLSNARLLDATGWSCLPKLNGLTMVRLRSDSANRPGMLHVVYSDGLHTVSLFERRGRLTQAPSGTRWSSALQAYVSTGVPATASWQSGSTVFTVVTDGSAELVTSTVTSLPHDPAPRPTTMARIRAGWARILHLSG